MSEQDEAGREQVERQVSHLFDALEWVFRQASADDREYLLSRGFRSVFRNDGVFRAAERRGLSAKAFNTLLPVLSVLNEGVDRAPDLLASFGPRMTSFGDVIALAVAAMKRAGIPATEKVPDLFPFIPSMFVFLSSLSSEESVASPRAAPSRPAGGRDFEKMLYDTILPWIREHRGELSEEAWIRIFLAAATSVDGKSPQRFLERTLAAAKRRS